MARTVDFSKPLSWEDRAYLLDRGRDSQVASLDAQYPPDLDELAEWTARRNGVALPTGDLGQVRRLEARVAQLEAYIAEELDADVPAVPGEEVEEEVAEDAYEGWTLAELQEEAGGRTPPLSKSGSKADIAARLREADAQ